MGQGSRVVPLRCQRMAVLHNSVQAQRHAEDIKRQCLAEIVLVALCAT
jgi:hypothetical protein